MKKYIIILFSIIITSVAATAQNSSIKIFSEIKNINIYLDDIFQGTDITTIDSVISGSHYLKVLKDNIIIYSELITVQPDTNTTILIKNTSSITEKLLASKTKEIHEYKNKKLDIILSQTYITETKGISSSYYFPGYYVVTGTGFYNSVSTSSSYTDWKIIQGENTVISEIEFAKLIGNKKSIEYYNKLYKEHQKRVKAANKKINRGSIIAIPSIIVTGVILADLLGSKPFLNLSSSTEAVIGTAGILGFVIGYSTVRNTKIPNFNPGHLTTVKEASEEAFKYNQALKKQLGLPENFEPNK